MKLKKFNIWVRMKNAKNDLISSYNEQSLYINTTNVGPVLVPLRQKESMNAPSKDIRKPKRKFEDYEDKDEDVVYVDGSWYK